MGHARRERFVRRERTKRQLLRYGARFVDESAERQKGMKGRDEEGKKGDDLFLVSCF